MKKFIWFLFLIAVITSVSACFFKKSEIKETQEVENVPAQKVIDTSKQPVVETPNQNMKECAVGKVLFQYPKTWGDCRETKNGISFRTDDSKYQVDLVLTLGDATNEEYSANRENGFNINKLNNNGEFFEVAQGGALMGGFISLNNKYYQFYFDVNSNQPVPENLDGVWTPDYEVTKDDLISILRSAK